MSESNSSREGGKRDSRQHNSTRTECTLPISVLEVARLHQDFGMHMRKLGLRIGLQLQWHSASQQSTPKIMRPAW